MTFINESSLALRIRHKYPTKAINNYNCLLTYPAPSNKTDIIHDSAVITEEYFQLRSELARWTRMAHVDVVHAEAQGLRQGLASLPQ